MLKFVAGGTFAVVLLSVGIGVGYASRNSSGTYTLATSAVTSNQVIGSALWNNTFNDLASEVTNSLSRDGQGGMRAALRGVDGTFAAPAFSFTSETGSGLYRIGASDVGFSISGTKKLELTSSLFTFSLPAKILSGGATTPTDISIGRTATDATLGVAGVASNYATGSVAGDVVLRTAAGKLWFDTNNGAGTPSLSIAGGNGTVTTGSLLNTSAGINMSSGVAADGSGFKHKRGVGGCTTAAVAGATCSSTVTWTTAFADANYTAVCNIDGSSGPAAFVGINSKIAASLSVVITAVTAVAATATTFECIAVHD